MDVEGDARLNNQTAYMNAIFRTDASIDIGTGHVMRCLTLAEVMRKNGIDCQFICREHDGNFLNEIQLRGFKFHTLPVSELDMNVDTHAEINFSYSSWLGVGWEEDARETEKILAKNRVDWLVVDHYALDVNWENYLRPRCERIMVIDDLANRMHDCDLLLDQNYGRNPIDYSKLIPKGCVIITGPKYALLRPEFAKIRSYSLSRRSTPKLKHLLISMGGIDKDNITEKVLDSLTFSHLPKDFKITVVIGESAPWLKNIYDKSKQFPWAIDVLVSVKNMAKLMANADLAIGAAGATSWERCCLGLPALILILSDNQQFIAHHLEEHGAVKIINTDTLNEDMPKVLDDINSFPELILKMSIAAAEISSGNGANNVLSYLTSKEV